MATCSPRAANSACGLAASLRRAGDDSKYPIVTPCPPTVALTANNSSISIFRKLLMEQIDRRWSDCSRSAESPKKPTRNHPIEQCPLHQRIRRPIRNRRNLGFDQHSSGLRALSARRTSARWRPARKTTTFVAGLTTRDTIAPFVSMAVWRVVISLWLEIVYDDKLPNLIRGHAV
jgi:hypothetical protein